MLLNPGIKHHDSVRMTSVVPVFLLALLFAGGDAQLAKKRQMSLTPADRPPDPPPSGEDDAVAAVVAAIGRGARGHTGKEHIASAGAQLQAQVVSAPSLFQVSVSMQQAAASSRERPEVSASEPSTGASPLLAVPEAAQEVPMVDCRTSLANQPKDLTHFSACITHPAFRNQVLTLMSSRTQWNGDLFHGADTFPDAGSAGLNFFTVDQSQDWFTLLAAVAALVLVDFFVVRRIAPSALNHVLIVLFWIAVGAVYMFIVMAQKGTEQGITWLSGYLLEWMLSIDNLFVFHLIFKLYSTPLKLMHKALFLGIIGAVLFRMVFFLALNAVLSALVWLRIILGLFLIYSGIQTAREDSDEEADPSDTFAVKLLKRCLGNRLTAAYDPNGDVFVVDASTGKVYVTLLFLVVCCCEITDVIFAVDSVSAKVAQIPDPYLCYSSSVLAMFGLRAMFFIVRDLVEYFEMLKYGLCLILVFIGLELVLANQLHLPSSSILVVIASTFAVCIAGSAIKKAKDVNREQLGGEVEKAENTGGFEGSGALAFAGADPAMKPPKLP